MKRALILGGILFGLHVASADGLDRSSIAAGIGGVKAKVIACGEKIKAGGTIKVSVTVGPDGKVTSAKRTAGDEKLGACVVDVIKTATFKPSTSGGSFSYPFVFAAPAAATMPAPGAALPPTSDNIERADIEAAIDAIKAKVVACGDKIKAGGKIKVSVTVGTDGKVSKAVRTDGDEKLGACVVDVVKTATFRATKNGGSFSYPFVFGTAAPTPPPATPPAPGAGGSALDRSMITDGIAAVKSKIQACGDSNKAHGKVKVRIAVAPAGTVTNADVEATPDAKLGACVADVLLHAKFAKTEQGGSFSYPFIF